jgi:hypothetical protein
VSLSFYKQCPPYPEENDFYIQATIVQSNSPSPPTEADDSSIVPKHSFKVPISSIPESVFVKQNRNSDGSAYWKLFYRLIIDVRNGTVKSWIDIAGQKYGEKIIS